MTDPRFSPNRGDRIGCVCVNCGDSYTHIEQVTQDPPRSTMRCPDCYAEHEQINNALVAGTWRVHDDDRREMFADLIRNNTEYDVYIEERVGSLYVYDPDEVDNHD